MLKELGQFKNKIATSFNNSELIRTILLGENYNDESYDVDSELKKYMKSNLYVKDTINTTDMYIFYDTLCPRFSTSFKVVRIIIYAICHKNIIDDISNLPSNIKKNYYGNRVDRLSQIIEEVLLQNKETSKSFGVGDLNLTDIGIYNSDEFYGKILTFEVPNFK